MKAIVFVGGGRITRALLAGLRLANFRGSLLVYDHHPEKLRQLRKLYGITIERSLDRAIAQARVLLIAVRPASISSLLHQIGAINRSLVAVSLAAGVPLASLQKRLPAPVRWARAMPSPACRSGRGLTALTFAHDFPAAAKREVRNLFAVVGQVLEIPDRKFDAFTVTYSCSHGYHALSTLSAAAEEVGLDRKTALTAAAHALADGIIAWRGGHIPLETLLQEAATPGGIAAGVMESMNRAGYKEVVLRGLAAGLSRARQNSKLL
jgi:pyrroline-5-carboxylate reductase